MQLDAVLRGTEAPTKVPSACRTEERRVSKCLTA